MVKCTLDSKEAISNFSPEGSLPPSKARGQVLEDVAISFIPDSQDANHKDFHEERLAKPLLGHVNIMMNISILIPKVSNGKPPIH
jgi:hypothetical protein